MHTDNDCAIQNLVIETNHKRSKRFVSGYIMSQRKDTGLLHPILFF